MYCTAPLSPRKGRPISFHDDDDDDDYCTDPDVSYGNGRGFPLDVHCWADLRSVHGFRCYDNVAPNAKCQRVFVLALSLYAWLVVQPYGRFHARVWRAFVSRLTSFFMVALWNRAGHIYFHPVSSFFFFLFFSSPNLSSRRLDVYHTSAHGVVLV